MITNQGPIKKPRTTAASIGGIPPVVHVDIDSREKYPVPFPSTILLHDPCNPSAIFRLPVKTHTVPMSEGDYRLSDFPNCCVIERKASQSELYNNLFDYKDSQRQARAFTRLSSCCQFPYLLIECSPADILKTRGTNYVLPIDPELILHRICIAAARYNLRTIWLPKPASSVVRRNTGRLLLQTMISHAIFKVAVPEGMGVVSTVDSAPSSFSSI